MNQQIFLSNIECLSASGKAGRALRVRYFEKKSLTPKAKKAKLKEMVTDPSGNEVHKMTVIRTFFPTKWTEGKDGTPQVYGADLTDYSEFKGDLKNSVKSLCIRKLFVIETDVEITPEMKVRILNFDANFRCQFDAKVQEELESKFRTSSSTMRLVSAPTVDQPELRHKPHGSSSSMQE